MKYEEIKVGEVYKNKSYIETVISKNDQYEAVMTVDQDGGIWGWDKYELKHFQPIKKELPESGLLVCNNGVIAYRLEGEKGFGFDENDFLNNEYWSFETDPKVWRAATPEEEAKFIKLLKAEAEKRGLGVDAKIKGHADGTPLRDPDYMGVTPGFKLDMGWNKNGKIFYNGIWAQPLTMLDEVCDAIKKHLPNIVVEQVDGIVTLKQL